MDVPTFDHGALWIVLPQELWPQIDRLRSRYGSEHPSLPPHLELMTFQPDSHLFSDPRNLAQDLSHKLERGVRLAFDSLRQDRVHWPMGQIQLRTEAPDFDPLLNGGRGVFLPISCRFHDGFDSGPNPWLTNNTPLDRICKVFETADPRTRRSGWIKSLKVGQALADVSENGDALQHSLLSQAKLLEGIEWHAREVHVVVTESSATGFKTTHSESISLTTPRETWPSEWKRNMPPDGENYYRKPMPPLPKEHETWFHDGTEWILESPSFLRQRGLPADHSAVIVASYNARNQNNDGFIQKLLHADAEADVLVVHDASTWALSLLLLDKEIPKKYAFCTGGPPHDPDATNALNANAIVVLSKYAFSWEVIPLTPKSAPWPSFGASPPKDELHIHNIDDQLPPRLDPKRGKSSSALGLLFQHKEIPGTDPLKQPKPVALVVCSLFFDYDRPWLREEDILSIEEYAGANTCMLVGNFNIVSSLDDLRHHLAWHTRRLGSRILESGYEEAWLATKTKFGTGIVCEEVPTVGSTDHDTVPADELSGLLDNIMVNSRSSYQFQSVNIFGDRRGVRAVLEHKPPAFVSCVHLPSIRGSPDLLALELSPHRLRVGIRSYSRDNFLRERSLDVQHVLHAVHCSGVVFSDESEAVPHAMVLGSLNSVLLENLPQGLLRVEPIGSYALGVWDASSDLDCLCIGSFSHKRFIELAEERLRNAGQRGVISSSIRRIETAAGTSLTLRMCVNGRSEAIKVDLTYARSKWPLPTPDAIESLPSDPKTCWALRALREVDYVKRSVPDIETFRLAHGFIRMWARSRGIYSAKFGYLSGIQITILLARVHKSLAKLLVAPAITEILHAFFKEYAEFKWDIDVVYDECFHDGLCYKKPEQSPVAIFGYFKPYLETSRAASKSLAWRLETEFMGAYRQIVAANEMPGATLFSSLSVLIPGPHFAAVNCGMWQADDPHDIICITAEYFGGSMTRGRRFVSWVESRLPSLLQDLETQIAPWFQIWPHRFAYISGVEEATAAKYLYIIDGPIHDFHTQTAARNKCVKRFVDEVVGDRRYFDSNSVRLHVTTSPMDMKELGVMTMRKLNPSSFQSILREDRRDWDSYMVADEDADAQGVGQGSKQVPNVQDGCHAFAKKRKNKKKTNGKPTSNTPRSVVEPKSEGAGRFRSAADVMSRLRWDSKYDQGDFVIGYEDRFEGAMEKDFDEWKPEQTHEEFIPQHRILYFKRKSDGDVVWERQTRKDKVFGSGGGASS